MSKSMLRLAGRVLIITLLLTSAVLKLSNPSSYGSTFKNTYTKSKQIFPFLTFLPPVDKVTLFLRIVSTLHE